MKYEALKRHLESRFALGDRRMRFAEIEKLLGFALPASARKHQAWWSNTRHGHSHAAAWLDAGWKTTDLDLASQAVTFVPDNTQGMAESGAPFDHAKAAPAMIDLANLSPAAQKLVTDEARRHGLSPSQAITALLDAAALQKRRTLLDWFAKASPPSDTDSVELIREDRDGR